MLVILSYLENGLLLQILSFKVILTLSNIEVFKSGIFVRLPVFTLRVSSVFIHHAYFVEGVELEILILFSSNWTSELVKLLSLVQILLDHFSILVNLSESHHRLCVSKPSRLLVHLNRLLHISVFPNVKELAIRIEAVPVTLLDFHFFHFERFHGLEFLLFSQLLVLLFLDSLLLPLFLNELLLLLGKLLFLLLLADLEGLNHGFEAFNFGLHVGDGLGVLLWLAGVRGLAPLLRH